LSEHDTLLQQYSDYKARGLSLNMMRGNPSTANIDLVLPMLSAVDETNYITDNGIDVRNYPGGVLGLIEAREMFCEQLRVAPDEIIIGNNSSLELMGRILMWSMLNGVQKSPAGWAGQSPKMLVTVPGYDRHFTLLKALGFEVIAVPMTANGPDMDEVERVVAADASIKGIFFVPTYSNPTSDTLSADTATRLVSMPTAADDFTIFADDAYIVHHLVDDVAAIPNLLTLAKEAGNDERVILFGSTSKVTFASGGLGMTGMCKSNIDYWAKALGTHSIGPNKVEQWRHVLFMRQYPGGLQGLMADHAKILKPKFEAVHAVLNAELGNRDLATWTEPRGGYFISLDTRKPIASRVVELAADAGVALTPCGATYPDGVDPANTGVIGSINTDIDLLIRINKYANISALKPALQHRTLHGF